MLLRLEVVEERREALEVGRLERRTSPRPPRSPSLRGSASSARCRSCGSRGSSPAGAVADQLHRDARTAESPGLTFASFVRLEVLLDPDREGADRRRPLVGSPGAVMPRRRSPPPARWPRSKAARVAARLESDVREHQPRARPITITYELQRSRCASRGLARPSVLVDVGDVFGFVGGSFAAPANGDLDVPSSGASSGSC